MLGSKTHLVIGCNMRIFNPVCPRVRHWKIKLIKYNCEFLTSKKCKPGSGNSSASGWKGVKEGSKGAICDIGAEPWAFLNTSIRPTEPYLLPKLPAYLNRNVILLYLSNSAMSKFFAQHLFPPIGGARVLLFNGILAAGWSTTVVSAPKFALELLRERSASDGGAAELKLASSSLAFLSTQR
jgi:hypothetical protein